MTEESSPGVEIIEAHEEFIQHLERGNSRVGRLSILTMVVALILLASYFSQLLLPFTTGTRFVQVDLLEPTLVVFEVSLLILTFAWVYVGAANYLFSSRLRRRVRRARATERELQRRITG